MTTSKVSRRFMRPVGVQMLSRYAQSIKNPAFAHLCQLYYSVIAVPGLGSHAIGSWKSPSDNDLWLRDYLPDDVPNIRILLYGHNTSLLGNESKDSIEDLGIRFLESIKAFRADNVCRIWGSGDYMAHSVAGRSPSTLIHRPRLRRLADQGGKAVHIYRRSGDVHLPNRRP